MGKIKQEEKVVWRPKYNINNADDLRLIKDLEQRLADFEAKHGKWTNIAEAYLAFQNIYWIKERCEITQDGEKQRLILDRPCDCQRCTDQYTDIMDRYRALQALRVKQTDKPF